MELFYELFVNYKNKTNFQSWSVARRTNERTKLLKVVLDIICGNEKYFPEVILKCIDNNIKEPKDRWNIREELRNRLNSKGKNLPYNILKFCLQSESYAIKRQFLSLFYQSGFEYKDIEFMCDELKKKYSDLENKHIVVKQTFAKYMKHIEKNPQDIGKLILQKRNKFFLDKNKLIQMIYEFCVLNSESMPNRSIMIDGEKTEKRCLKTLSSRTSIFLSFVHSFEDGFGENESKILSILNQEELEEFHKFRNDRRIVKEIINSLNLEDTDSK